MKQLIFLSLIALSLTACTSMVKKADYAPSVIMPEDANPAPIKWSGIELLLPPGMDIGEQRYGTWCTSPAYPVNRTALRKKIDQTFLRQTFHDALEANGYDVVDSIDLIDEERRDDLDRAEYSIKAKVRDVQVDMCHKKDKAVFVFERPEMGTEGQFYLAIDWSVWSPLTRSTAYKVRTEGYTDRKLPNLEGITLMFNDAFEMAAHNLAADPQFHDLIVKGIKPKDFLKSTREQRLEQQWESRPRQFDPLENVTLPPTALSRQPFKKWADEGRKAVVMVQKFGHGSGFFITKQGHIITNAHVVGDSGRVRIVTANKEHKLTAEVLRLDKVRDVALLKLEEIPEDLEITTLPVRTEWPKVSEDVYAIGAPRDWRDLTDTVTKGIVSAHRQEKIFKNVRQNYIQADVEIHGGNSGGPLLDEDGNLIGITVLAEIAPGTNVGIGLNYFIPIGEALDRLNIHTGPLTGAPQNVTSISWNKE